MNRDCLVIGVIGFFAVIGWNIFLIQRDDAMFKAYYKQQTIENLNQSK